MSKILTPKEWHKLETTLEKIERRTAVEDLISEKEAAALLGIKPETLAQNVSTKKVPETHYKVGACNKRFYFKSKMMGL